jgi:hypothetical protein
VTPFLIQKVNSTPLINNRLYVLQQHNWNKTLLTILIAIRGYCHGSQQCLYACLPAAIISSLQPTRSIKFATLHYSWPRDDRRDRAWRGRSQSVAKQTAYSPETLAWYTRSGSSFRKDLVFRDACSLHWRPTFCNSYRFLETNHKNSRRQRAKDNTKADEETWKRWKPNYELRIKRLVTQNKFRTSMGRGGYVKAVV